MEEKRSLQPPSLAIITVTYNSSHVLDDFLSSLSQQSFRDWILIAVDNASVDDSVKQLRTWRDPRLILYENAENIGFGAGTNRGITLASQLYCPWILILNNDTLFEPDFFEKLMARAIKRDALALAPRIVYASRPDFNWFAGGHFSKAWGFRATLEGEGQRHQPAFAGERWIDFAPGCCKLVSSELIRAHGGFDEDFFVYWEDTDLCWRWRKAGIAIRYLGNISLAHKVSSLTGGEFSNFSIHMYHKNQLLFLRKHFGERGSLARGTMVVAKICLRRLLGMDSKEVTGLKMRAILEGYRQTLGISIRNQRHEI